MEPAEYRLAALSASDSQHKSGRNLPQIGVRRAVPAEALSSAAVVTLADGRRLWRTTISSPGASALRVHFRNFAASGGELWIYPSTAGVDPAQAEGPYTGAGPFGDGDFWTGVVNSESATIEFAAPAGSDALPPFSIDSVVHVWDAPLAPLPDAGAAPAAAPLPGDRVPEHTPPSLPQAGSQAGASQAAAACHLDVTCYPELANYATATAQYSFNADDGGAYVCSGTMVVTRSRSFKPYFLTAHHCIGSESEARSMYVRFNYQTSTCNGTPPDRTLVPHVIGATYLGGAAIEEGDYALVLLNGDPPAGTYFLGWDQSTSAIALDGSATGIHHPAGSWKRVSFGNRTADEDAFVQGEYAPASLYYSIHWTQGLIEGGSSGSALLNGQGQVVGTLTYGPRVPPDQTVCDIDPSAGYGRFSNAYNALRAFFEDTTPPDLSATPTSLSFSATNGRFTSASYQNLTVRNNTASTLQFSATPSADWIQVSPTGAPALPNTGTLLSVTVDLTKFSRSTQATGTIRITSGSMVPLSVTVNANITVSASKVTVAVNPSPIVQQTPDVDGYAWFYRVVLTETAGVPATINVLKIGGADYSSSISSWFGSNQLPANGTLTASLRTRGLTPPVDRVYEVGGTDSGGGTWTAQTVAHFVGRPSGAIVTLGSSPTLIRQNPDSTTCPWRQQLTLQENGGFSVTLNRFKAGEFDLASRITEFWGTTTLPPNGTLKTLLCWTGISAPDSIVAEVGGTDSAGQTVTSSVTSAFSGPAANPTTMSLSGGAVKLAAATGYSSALTDTRSLQLGSSLANWTGRLLFSNNLSTNWLSVSPLSGTGPATLRFTAPPGMAAGSYSATLELTSIDAVPALINVPITLDVSSQAGNPVAAQLFPHIADGAEWQTEFLLTNDGAVPVLARVLFHLDGGATGVPMMNLGVVSAINNIMVPAHGSVFYRTAGDPWSPLVSGWAELLATSPLTGQALFRRHAADGNYYEGAVPLMAPANGFTMPFDGTNFAGTSFFTGLAIANADSMLWGTVTCSAYDEGGRLLSADMQLAILAPSGHFAPVLQWTKPFDAILGTNRGLLVCNSTRPIGVLGLRFFGFNALASLPVVTH